MAFATRFDELELQNQRGFVLSDVFVLMISCAGRNYAENGGMRQRCLATSAL